jgi:hypothetical protein
LVGPTPGHASGSTRARGTLLLADISGYTGFLQGVAEAHHVLILDSPEPPPAYTLMSSLMEAIMLSIFPPFRLAKLEGDAVFAVAADEDLPLRGTAVVECLRACNAAFDSRLAEANSLWTCTCGSCSRVRDLGLKFVVHHGEYIVQRIAGMEEILGHDVNVAHRLLKNHARDLVGPQPYVLFSDAALAGLDVPDAGMVPATETYADIPAIAVHVLPLAQAAAADAETPAG